MNQLITKYPRYLKLAPLSIITVLPRSILSVRQGVLIAKNCSLKYSYPDFFNNWEPGSQWNQNTQKTIRLKELRQE